MVNKFFLAFGIFFLFAFKNIDNKDSHSSINNIHSTFDNKIENEIFVYINLHRKSVGLKPLQLNEVESSAAAKHSNNMASGKVSFGHAGFQKRIKNISNQLGNIEASAENVAEGTMNAKEVVNVWLQSPEHKKNIEGDYTLTGIGVVKSKKGVTYFTEIFTK
ncbi:MAG TPA: CAP domain-containing protein [Puia sp.]|nr:CAP domain-containing protein [Puia sp.]